jgi:hypothetical protein
LNYGDLFTYTEHYTDGTTGKRLALCHGRIRENANNTGTRDWMILAQAANDLMTFTYERWIAIEDVIETCGKDAADVNIVKFFENTIKV